MNGVLLSNRYFGYEDIHATMESQVYDWLVENVGRGSREGGWIPECEWLWCWSGKNLHQAVVVIPNAEKAMLFKLTFG